MEANEMKHDGEHHGKNKIDSKVVFGFWIYLITDAVMFAGLLASYGVLKSHTFGSLDIKQITKMCMSSVFFQTILFTISTLTISMSASFVKKGNKAQGLVWVLISFILAVVFVKMSYSGLSQLYKMGYSWHNSAFLSAYFTLIGVQLLHILVAILWAIILIVQLVMRGANCGMMKTRFVCLSLFWSYLNIIWLIIFSVVYLIGAI